MKQMGLPPPPMVVCRLHLDLLCNGLCMLMKSQSCTQGGLEGGVEVGDSFLSFFCPQIGNTCELNVPSWSSQKTFSQASKEAQQLDGYFETQ